MATAVAVSQFLQDFTSAGRTAMGAAVKKYDNGADETVPPRKSVWSLEFSFHFALSSPASVFWFYTVGASLVVRA